MTTSTTQPPARLCVFCRCPGKLTNEHVLPHWLSEGEDSSRMAYVRERGGPDHQPWRHSRAGKPRDLQAKAPCATCNNGWMNDMDNELIVLGPQLVKGKAVRLTKARQASLAAWSVKLILMLQQVYPRDSRFVIPETDYTQFYADRQPSHLMRLWAGYMEPPGQHGGAIRAFAEHRHDEMHYDAGLLTALSLSAPAAAKGYTATFRLGYLMIGLHRPACAELIPFQIQPTPRHWVPIWPALGTRTWPPAALPPVIGLAPLDVRFRPPSHAGASPPAL
jgi:hypothetical protein